MTTRKWVLDLMLAVAAAFALAAAAASFAWPAVRDLQIALYEGFLIHDLDYVPYRDFYELNAPGTMLWASFVHQATGGILAAIHLLDCLVLAAIGLFSGLALGRHGWRTGVLAGATFASLYFTTGPASTLQREYLCVLPLAVSVALVFRRDDVFRGKVYPLFLAGAMAGLAATVKPPLVLCWLPLFAYDAYFTWQEATPERRARLWRMAAAWAAGGLAPLLLVVAWLAFHQALGPFLEVVRGYYPLYTEIDGSGEVFHGRSWVHFRQSALLTLELLASPGALLAFVGITAGWSAEDRRLWAQNAVLGGLALAGIVYVGVTGKFWLYHRIPLTYAFALAASMVFSRGLAIPFSATTARTLTLAAALIAGLPLEAYRLQQNMWGDPRQVAARIGAADLMADYLRRNASAEDTILPLDTVTGALAALYQLRRPLYGEFIYDNHFYHHGTSPYIAGLRRRMLAQFAGGKPSLVLRCESWRPRDTGADGSFPELEAVLRDDYVQVLQANDCVILRRR